MRTAEEIVRAINDYWKFDDNQQPMSSWHDKQDLIAFIEGKYPEAYGAIENGINTER